MTVKVAINGFGRIGRNIVRAIYESGRKDIDVVAINDLGPVETNAHLLRYDSVHGRFPSEVKVDGDTISVGNGASVGGGTELTPEADPEDGKVDVMIARAQGGMAPLGYAWHLMRSRHHERDDVLYLRAREVSVSGEKFYCSADGEVYGPERKRTWHVEPAAYRFVFPG